MLTLVLLALVVVTPGLQADENEGAPSIMVDIPVSTQGPLWPPSEVTNEDGDFVVLGITLNFVPEINFALPEFSQAVLVSKDSRPAFNPDGTRNLDNWFLAGFDIIRPLDLSEGSPDLDMVFYNLSMGPPDESGVRRIPAEGDSAFNLNTDASPCPEIFPGPAQLDAYSRPRFPLHEVPVWGFQGDQIAYDVVTGDPLTPVARAGSLCPDGCAGENVIDFRPLGEPITLRGWLWGRATLKVTLSDFREDLGAYTAADFDFRLKHAIPDSVYTVWTIRPRRIPDSTFAPQADPLDIPNVITTNHRGNGRATFHVRHPFPAPEVDVDLERITGVVIAWHPDYQNWGACGAILGAGVDIVSHFSSIANGNLDITPFVTVDPGD